MTSPDRSRPTARPRGARVLPVVIPAMFVLALLLAMAPSSAAAADGVWPLEPEPTVVHGFDPPEVTWGSGHRGVDLRGRPGAPVRAALPGRVTFAGSIAGRGVVVVDHGSTRTTYEPVAAVVGRGTVVAAGEVIGTLLRRGSHCAPRTCLHWGWKRGEIYLDPLDLVDGPRPVRLWPAAGPPAGAGPERQGLDPTGTHDEDSAPSGGHVEPPAPAPGHPSPAGARQVTALAGATALLHILRLVASFR